MDHESCHHLLGSLSEFVDGSLQEYLCNEIERHLTDCEDCRVVIDSLKKTIYLYHTTRDANPMPDEVRQRLYLRLELDEFLDRS